MLSLGSLSMYVCWVHRDFQSQIRPELIRVKKARLSCKKGSRVAASSGDIDRLTIKKNNHVPKNVQSPQPDKCFYCSENHNNFKFVTWSRLIDPAGNTSGHISFSYPVCLVHHKRPVPLLGSANQSKVEGIT